MPASTASKVTSVQGKVGSATAAEAQQQLLRVHTQLDKAKIRFENQEKRESGKWVNVDTSVIEFDQEADAVSARREAAKRFVVETRRTLANERSATEHAPASPTLRGARRAAREYRTEFGDHDDVQDDAQDVNESRFWQAVEAKARLRGLTHEQLATKTRHQEMSKEAAKVVIHSHMRRYLAKQRWKKAQKQALEQVRKNTVSGYSRSLFSPSVMVARRLSSPEVKRVQVESEAPPADVPPVAADVPPVAEDVPPVAEDVPPAAAYAPPLGRAVAADSTSKTQGPEPSAAAPVRPRIPEEELDAMAAAATLDAPRLGVMPKRSLPSPPLAGSTRRRPVVPPPWAKRPPDSDAAAHLAILLRSSTNVTGDDVADAERLTSGRKAIGRKPRKNSGRNRVPLEATEPPPVRPTTLAYMGEAEFRGVALDPELEAQVNAVLMQRTAAITHAARKREAAALMKRKAMENYQRELAAISHQKIEEAGRSHGRTNIPKLPLHRGPHAEADRDQTPLTPRLALSLPRGSPRGTSGRIYSGRKEEPQAPTTPFVRAPAPLAVAPSTPRSAVNTGARADRASSARAQNERRQQRPGDLNTHAVAATAAAAIGEGPLDSPSIRGGQSQASLDLPTPKDPPSGSDRFMQPHTAPGLDYDGQVRAHPMVILTVRVPPQPHMPVGVAPPPPPPLKTGTPYFDLREGLDLRGERKVCNEGWGNWRTDPAVKSPTVAPSGEVERPSTAPALHERFKFSYTRLPFTTAARGRHGALEEEILEDSGCGWVSRVSADPKKYGFAQVPRKFERSPASSPRRRINQRVPSSTTVARRDRLDGRSAAHRAANEDVFVCVAGSSVGTRRMLATR